ncbi:hypothetical protein [Streptosporangium roseum]|uniref:hypothetical protein n=1 Tax=Streptosporangium roseum TaxID=2001 RepID=UPI00331671CF
MSRLADADPLPRIYAHLGGHPAVIAELGAAGRVGSANEPPYPRLLINDVPGGSENLTTWVVGMPVRLEALGTLDGPTIGKEKLRLILYVALGVLAEMPAIPVEAGEVVINHVGSSIAGGYVPLADGRPRYVATVTVTAHPG